jgi:hypothetical protein
MEIESKHDYTRAMAGIGAVDDFFDVPNLLTGFFTYHGFLTITSSSHIISLD